jgi:tetratricopeptide (TPR) repeat protein
MKLYSILLLLAFSLSFSAPSAAAKLEPCMTEQCKAYFKGFKKAAKNGHQKANVVLGNFYYYGYGVESNPRTALTYFKKAARGKITSAQYMAGLLYVSESDFQDVEEGIEYLEKAAQNNHKTAKFMLGVVYLTDEYGVKNVKKADEYLASAYESRQINVPEIIDHIKKSTEITNETFPMLAAQINSAPMLESEEGKSKWPDDEIERITISGPSLTNMLNSQLLSMRKPIKSLGTRFKGKSCAERIECKSTTADKLDDFSSIVILPGSFGIVSR